MKLGVVGLIPSALDLVGLWIRRRGGHAVPRLWILGLSVVFLASLVTALMSPSRVVTTTLTSSGDDHE